MKTLPILIKDFTKLERHNLLLREYLSQDIKKMNRPVIVNIPSQKPNLFELIAENENIDFSEKIKQFNKEFFKF